MSKRFSCPPPTRSTKSANLRTSQESEPSIPGKPKKSPFPIKEMGIPKQDVQSTNAPFLPVLCERSGRADPTICIAGGMFVISRVVLLEEEDSGKCKESCSSLTCYEERAGEIGEKRWSVQTRKSHETGISSRVWKAAARGDLGKALSSTSLFASSHLPLFFVSLSFSFVPSGSHEQGKKSSHRNPEP